MEHRIRMDRDLWMLAGTAGAIGVLHSVLSPDHYVPFIMMRRAQKWSAAKTALVTLLCGIGHVSGSFLLGIAGIVFGLGLSQLNLFESLRGTLSAWMLFGFGLAYCAWGVRHAIKNRPHTHWHAHTEGVVHVHGHAHRDEHAHVHQKADAASLTPWVLFVIFVLGPCEALIPIFMYPAYEMSATGVALVSVVFTAATIGTMLFMVAALELGLERFRLGRYERYGHVMAGAALAICGSAILVLTP